MDVSSVSVLIATYNRAAQLGETLGAVAALRRPAACRLELVVVDNNSADGTRRVVETMARRVDFAVVYEFEPRQGKSIALNRGITRATGDVIALTDDDVVPDLAWLERIVAAFRSRDLAFVFGKVLPRWGGRPSDDLMTIAGQEIWGPLALLDYGDIETPYTEDNIGMLRLPIGANLAFARSAIARVGGWRPDLGKVDNSLIAGEDYEIFFRLRDAGLYAGLYDPLNIVHHYVPAHRLTRTYFRRWFFWNGRTIARMLPESYPEIDFSNAPLILGAPRFVYRQMAGQWLRWVKSRRTDDRLRRVIEEMYTYRYLGILIECWKQRRHVRKLLQRRPTTLNPAGGSARD